MKYSTIIFVTAAVSLAACHDSTAPEALATSPVDALVSVAEFDSSNAWVAIALDDAATRLLSTFADGKERISLQRALRALSATSARGDSTTILFYRDHSHEALARLRVVSDPASNPDLDAIALAIDGATSRLVRREHY